MPPEGFLDMFGPDSGPIRQPGHDSEKESASEQEFEPADCPLVIAGKLGEKVFSAAIASIVKARAENPYRTDGELFSDAYSDFDLHGNEWKTGFAWARRHRLISAKKELTPLIKPVKNSKSLRRYGGNPNADKALPPERE